MVADTDPESMVLSALIRAIRGKNFSVPSVGSCKNQKLEDFYRDRLKNFHLDLRQCIAYDTLVLILADFGSICIAYNT